MWCQTPNGESLLPVALLAIGEEFRIPSHILLVPLRLGGFLILVFSLLLPFFNKHLDLHTAGIVSTAISNKIGFVKWYASKGGWVCYANDFPNAWSGYDLIVGASSGVPIKREVVKAIGAVSQAASCF